MQFNKNYVKLTIIRFVYIISNNIFMLCHHGDSIIPQMNNSITYNDGNSLLLTDN